MDISKIKNYLEEEGFRPKIDEDGDIVFKYEGGTYFIDSDKADELFIRIGFPNFWPIENDDERTRAIKAAHELTKDIKVAKIYVVDGHVWGTVELFLNDEDTFASIFPRCMLALQGAVQGFISSMEKNT